MFTDLDKMAIALRLNDLAQRLIDLREQQGEVIAGLLDTVQEYADYCEKSAIELRKT